MSYSISMFMFVALLANAVCLSWGLEMEGIEMIGGHRFAQLHSRTTLVCRFTLEDGQEIDKLGWFSQGIPVLTWVPPDAPVAGTAYKDTLDLTSTNGSLTFEKVEADHAGSYTCTVQTKDSKQKSSEEFSFAVADVPSAGFSMNGKVENCTLEFSFSSPPIYPKPTPLCGVWATDTHYASTATDWQAVPFYNGSVAYAINGTSFNVRSMPLQAGIRCEMSFMLPGAEEKIIAWQNTAYYPEVSERGCPILEVGDHLQVDYKNYRPTCRGELAKEDPSMEISATVSCSPGTYSNLRGGSLSTINLRCLDQPNWELLGSVQWYELDEMECTDTPPSGKAKDRHNDESVHAVHEAENVEENMVENLSSDATCLIPAQAIILNIVVMSFKRIFV